MKDERYIGMAYIGMAVCISNINDWDDSELPLKEGKIYRVYDEDSENYWVEDENGFIEHYYKDLFKLILT